MRSARILLVTAAASAALALGAPGAYATGDDWDHEDPSHSKEYNKDHGKDHGHDSPRGGMHTGGGALAAVNEGDWSTEKDSGTSKDGGKDKESWGGKNDKESWGGGHDSPRGGMHTGGGALAAVNEGDWSTEKDSGT
ncbi:hypothetical protein, partial [Streptomyces sp. NPDC002845]